MDDKTRDLMQRMEEAGMTTSRRDFLKKTCGAVLAMGLISTSSIAFVGCDSAESDDPEGVNTGDPGISRDSDVITIDTAEYPELATVGGSLWIVNAQVLVIHPPEGYRAFSSICPHEQEPIRIFEESNGDYRMRCPSHDWTFDTDGDPLGVADEGTEEFEVDVEDDLVQITIFDL